VLFLSMLCFLTAVFLLDAMQTNSIRVRPTAGSASSLMEPLLVLLGPVATSFDLEASLCVVKGGIHSNLMEASAYFDQ